MNGHTYSLGRLLGAVLISGQPGPRCMMGIAVPVSGKGEMELLCSLCKDLEVLFG